MNVILGPVALDFKEPENGFRASYVSSPKKGRYDIHYFSLEIARICCLWLD